MVIVQVFLDDVGDCFGDNNLCISSNKFKVTDGFLFIPTKIFSADSSKFFYDGKGDYKIVRIVSCMPPYFPERAFGKVKYRNVYVGIEHNPKPYV